MAKECNYTDLIPFNRKLLTKRLKNKNANRNDLINHPLITFSANQLSYFEGIGSIPEKYSDQINNVLSSPDFKGSNILRGYKYTGPLVDFGASEYFDIKNRCKKVNITFTELLMLEHIATETVRKYKKERHIPSDLLEKIDRRLNIMEADKDNLSTVEELKPESSEMYSEAVKTVKTYKSGDYSKITDKLKTVVHCNGEASLNLNNIPDRYDCDLETFINSVFNLVSNEGYVIYTTFNNGKPIFSLGESM